MKVKDLIKVIKGISLKEHIINNIITGFRTPKYWD